MSQAPAPAPATETAAAAPAKSSKMKKLIAGVAVLALVGGGGFYWKTQQASAASAESVDDAEEPAKTHEARGLVSFDPFVVNLADPVPRFLRVSMQLVVESPEQASTLEHSKVAIPQARSVILELLTTQTSDVLVTSEGKSSLRAAIVEKVSRDIPEFKVFDVLFSDFVVQF